MGAGSRCSRYGPRCTRSQAAKWCLPCPDAYIPPESPALALGCTQGQSQSQSKTRSSELGARTWDLALPLRAFAFYGRVRERGRACVTGARTVH